MAIGLGSLIAFLEEGQNQDWFANVSYPSCCGLAIIFVPAYLVIEFVSKHPVVNLRLLSNRNLMLNCAVNFLRGVALYGYLYLLPQYVEQVVRTGFV